MGDIKLFAKVHCKAYMAKICDTVHIQFYNADGTFCYNKTVTDYGSKAIAYGFDEEKCEEIELADLSEFDGESVEKTYRKRTECEFDGFVVGYTRLDVKGRIGTDWNDPGYGSEYGFCFKMITERPKVAVVYFKNNMKRYVLPEDMKEVNLMPKVYCAASDCKWNDVNNRCRAKEIHLEDNHIMTTYDGRQHFNRCQDYEMSKEMKKIAEELERMMKNDGTKS